MLLGRRRKPFQIKFKKATFYTFSSVAMFVLAGIVVTSFSRKGIILQELFTLMTRFLGWAIIFLPFIFTVAGLMLARLNWSISQPNVLMGGLVLLFSLTGLTQSGIVGLEIWQNLAVLISPAGAVLVLSGFAFIGLVITFNTSLEEIVLGFSRFIDQLKRVVEIIQRGRVGLKFPSGPPVISKAGLPAEVREGKPVQKEGTKALAGIEIVSGKASPSALGRPWQYPPMSLLLDSVSGKADRGDINKNAEVIEKTLESFGITAHVAEVNYGPAVTQYALQISLGTKLSKITALANDLALALAAPTGQIRIEAPVPGRSLVGVEVPNLTPEFVALKQMLNAEKMKKSKSKLTVALGLDVSGQPVVADIGRMPHVLIAGATGSGKSVAINSFIASILYRATPDEVKFIMIDPKRVELTQYNGIPHLLTPVIIEPPKVLSALGWATSEMDARYKKFAEEGVRNIEAYHEKGGFVQMPYIVIVVDELADIMFFSPAAVEDVICRIAQMARATGIHLVISTQRPSVDVITGLIKANIPCRIAFNVSSMIDSRVIIDMPGAEKLLGRGDMLYIPPDQAKPTRIQGTFVSDGEIAKIIDFLRRSGEVHYTEEVTAVPVMVPGMRAGVVGEMEEKDPLIGEAIRVIKQYKRASASLLQRRLSVGYSRGARIIDQLAEMGLVGPSEGAKPRELNLKAIEEYLATYPVAEE